MPDDSSAQMGGHWDTAKNFVQGKLDKGKRRYFLFADQVGSSTAGADDAERLLLNFLHNFIVGNSGAALDPLSVVKFIGDEVMLVFESADIAIKAARSALENIERYNRGVAADRQIHTRMGIHGGTCSLKDENGEIQRTFIPQSSPWKPLENEFFSPDIVLARRIMSLAGPDELLISEETWTKSSGPNRAAFVELSKKARVKGVSKSLVLYRLTTGTPQQHPRARLPHPQAMGCTTSFAWHEVAKAIKECHEQIRAVGENYAALEKILAGQTPQNNAWALNGAYGSFASACRKMRGKVRSLKLCLARVPNAGDALCASLNTLNEACRTFDTQLAALQPGNQPATIALCRSALEACAGLWTWSANLDQALNSIALDAGASWE